ncbi:MAG: hypothetical protein JWL82_306, partial [Parcubacteria group bacterium]|nr:hypothetical protein [Parcubacteria group bacterium]
HIIHTPFLTPGTHTISFTVDNAPVAGSDGLSNPAGLLYKLTLNGTSCGTPAPTEPTTIKVHILKYLKSGEGEVAASGELPSFPMASSWNASNIGAGNGTYSLSAAGYGQGPYAADTASMSAPADYATNEVTDGSPVLPIGAACEAGKYRLVGYQSGNTLEEALASTASETAPNFTGLNHDKYVVVENEKCSDTPAPQTSAVTLCKFNDQQQPLAGWNLTLTGEHVQDLSVDSTNSAGVNSNPLAAGVSYLATALGTWTNQGGANPVDAEYSTTDGWATHMDGYTGYGAGILETEINQTDGNWGPYNNAHSYAQSFIQGTNAPANFRIFDGDTGTHVQNEGWFGDNNGSVAIGLFKGYAGITSDNGCVTFSNVPYGAYTVGETAQDNWSTVSGTGPVTVDSATETFNVVNHYTAPKYRVHIFKYLDNGQTVTQIPNDSTAPQFPMIAQYAIAGVYTNLNPGDGFILGNGGGAGGSDDGLLFAANTIPLSAGDTYGAHEVTGGESPVVASAELCSAGKYFLEGYKVGDTLSAAQAAEMTLTSPNFESVSKDEYVIVVNKACDTTPPPPTTLKVHLYKYLYNGDGGYNQVQDNFSGPQFPMVSTWMTSNLNGGATSSSPYVLGNGHGGAAFTWAADTAPMNAPANYESHEVTDGSVVVASANECTAGKYYLVGYRNGSSLLAAESAPITSSPTSYFGITSDQYEIVLNRACPSGPVITNTNETIVVKAADLAATFVDVMNDPTKWFFYNDNSDTINDALGSFVNGPATAPAGSGSAQIMDDAVNNRIDLATYGFAGTKLSDIKTLAFSAYSHSGVAGATESPFMVFNVDFDGSDTWQKRMVFVPSDNGGVPQDTWNTYDAINSGAAMWVYSGAVWPGSVIPGTTPRTWSDILAAYPNVRVRVSDGFMGVRVGEPGPTNYIGNIDKFVIGVQTGSNIDTKTFDFEPTALTQSSSTVVVKAADLETTTDIPTAATNNSSKWFFYNDTIDAINNALGSFVTGPATAPAGSGSAEMTDGATPNDRIDIATYAFSGVKLADLTSLAFSAYSHSGVAGATESPYLVFNVDFTGVSGAFQKRLVYVPSDNGAVPQDAWNTYDTINGGAGKWVYSGATWPVTGQPGTTAKTWAQILTDYPNARVLPLGGLMGVRVGEPGPTNYTGDVDKFVIGIQTGTNVQTTTYDFEPTAPPTTGGPQTFRSHSSSSSSGGSVLGASTSNPQVLGESCGLYMEKHLRLGSPLNDVEQAKKIQAFLNKWMQTSLPITGFFGPMTTAAVKAFQSKYADQILKPWGITSPTGIVYYTTLHQINMLECPELTLALPPLVEWSQNPNAQ